MTLHIFNQLNVGIVLLDRHAKVLFANVAAQFMAKEDSPVRVASCLTCSSASHSRHLGGLIRSTLGGIGMRAMSLPSSAGEPRLLLTISPFNDPNADRRDGQTLQHAAALVTLHDLRQPNLVSSGWLMDAYGLTQAEARVALAAASGSTIAETARRLDISVNTVKTHLRRVFHKTGASRQADLARLVANVGIALRNEQPSSN